MRKYTYSQQQRVRLVHCIIYTEHFVLKHQLQHAIDENVLFLADELILFVFAIRV